MTTRKIPGTKYVRPHDSGTDSTTGTPTAPRPGQYGDVKLYAGSSGVGLAQEVAEYIGITLGERQIKQFSNENFFITLAHSVRGQDVYLIQGMTAPVSDNILELLIMLDTLKRDSAGRI